MKRNFEVTEKKEVVTNIFNKEDEKMVEHLLRKMLGLSEVEDLPAGMRETPHRIAKYWTEVISQGYLTDPVEHLGKVFDIENHEATEDVGIYENGIVACKFKLYSTCEHHMAIFGTFKDDSWIYVLYIPKSKVVGLSKIPRMARGYAQRFQIQEKLTQQIADAIWNTLDPRGVMVVMKDLTHTCVVSRGVKAEGATTTTSCVRGDFATDPKSRAEALALISKM